MIRTVENSQIGDGLQHGEQGDGEVVLFEKVHAVTVPQTADNSRYAGADGHDDFD